MHYIFTFFFKDKLVHLSCILCFFFPLKDENGMKYRKTIVYERTTVWSYELKLSTLTLHFLAEAHGKVKCADMPRLDYLN